MDYNHIDFPAPSPMVVSPAPRGRRPQTGGKRGGVSGVIHNFRKIAITRARYNKIKSNIRNKFCQRKTRKRKDAKIASAEKKDEVNLDAFGYLLYIFRFLSKSTPGWLWKRRGEKKKMGCH